MSQSQRIRIVIGLTFLIAGIPVGIIASMIAGALVLPRDASDMVRHTTQVHDAGSLMTLILISGVMMSAAGVILVFVELTRWFVAGPKPAA